MLGERRGGTGVLIALETAGKVVTLGRSREGKQTCAWEMRVPRPLGKTTPGVLK